MKIGFIGIGKLGKDVSEVMAEKYDVVGYDIEEVDTTIKMVDTPEEAVADKDIVFIAVPTPHQEDYDGRYPTSHLPPRDFGYDIVCGVLQQIARYINEDTLVVVISTVLPGTTRREFIDLLPKGHLVYNPYFIAQGTVKDDMRNPEMIIIGTDTGEGGDVYKKMCDFYAPLVENDPRMVLCTWEEGEAIKVFYNTFITTKICFANMVQDVAEATGNMDVDVVTNAIAESTMRIMSPRYMAGGLGDGGGCHPRDNIALRYLSEQLDLGYDMFGELMKTREMQARNMAGKLASYGRDVVIMGRGFKPGVDQEEGSPSILVGHCVEQMGVRVYYDKAPHDEPCVYLVSHGMPDDLTVFNKGSVVIDPMRGGVKMSRYMTYVPYGNTR